MRRPESWRRTVTALAGRMASLNTLMKPDEAIDRAVVLADLMLERGLFAVQPHPVEERLRRKIAEYRSRQTEGFELLARDLEALLD